MKKKQYEAIAGILLLYLIMELLGITCPIKFLTGVSCAGCGMSRAWKTFLLGDFIGAFSYHPLFLLVIPGAGILLLRKRMPRKLFRGLVGGAVFLLLAVYFIRLLNPRDTVVVFRPVEGLIPRIIQAIR